MLPEKPVKTVTMHLLLRGHGGKAFFRKPELQVVKTSGEAFLFDGSGRLVYHGAIDDNAQAPDRVESHYLRDALAAVVAGVEVPRAETKALGCTIKFRGR